MKRIDGYVLFSEDDIVKIDGKEVRVGDISDPKLKAKMTNPIKMNNKTVVEYYDNNGNKKSGFKPLFF